MQLNDKTYNFLKFIVTIFLPAVGSLYFGLANLWDIPNPMGVNATINLFALFLGSLIGVSSHQYKKNSSELDGDLVIQKVDGEKYPALVVNETIEAMERKGTVRLKVVEAKLPVE